MKDGQVDVETRADSKQQKTSYGERKVREEVQRFKRGSEQEIGMIPGTVEHD